MAKTALQRTAGASLPNKGNTFPSLRTVSDEWIKETIPARTSGWSTSQIIVLYDAQRIDGDKAPQCFVQLTVILSTMQKNIPLTLLI